MGAHAGIEFQARHHLPCQHLQQRDVLQIKSFRIARQHSQGSHHLLRAGDQRNAHIGAAWFRAKQWNTGRREAAVLRGIANQQRLALFQQPMVGSSRARLLLRIETESRLEPQAIEIHPADVRIISVTQHGGELGKLVQRRVGVAVEHLEFLPQSYREMIDGMLSLHCVHKIHDHPPQVSSIQRGLTLPQRWEFEYSRITT